MKRPSSHPPGTWNLEVAPKFIGRFVEHRQFFIENRKSGKSRKIPSATRRIIASWHSETWDLMNNFKTNFYIFHYKQGESTTSL